MKNFHTKISVEENLNDVSLHESFSFIEQFSILNLKEGEDFSLDTGGKEFGVLVLEGTCSITVEEKDYGTIGSRTDVFSGIPSAVYVPCDSRFSIKGSNAKIALCGGKCSQKTEPALITPGDIKLISAGKDNWSRDVRIIIGPDSPSVNMILGETINPPGNWSGVPPAKHENNNLPEESLHDELYYFRTDKPQGWGIERIYSPERKANELIYLEDNTVTFMPWGYHQIVSAPGYTLYYLFFLSGEGNKLAQFEDPDHNWIKNA